MFSERAYWIALIIGFTGFALVVWFLFVPYGIIEYGLGVNIFTSSIFMVLTVIFLTWMIDLRERIQWKTVEANVLHKIMFEIGYAKYALVVPSDPADTCSDSESDMTADEVISQSKKNGCIPISKRWESILTKYPDSPKLLYYRRNLAEILDFLNDCEIRYTKFLNSDQRLWLLEVTDDLNFFLNVILASFDSVGHGPGKLPELLSYKVSRLITDIEAFEEAIRKRYREMGFKDYNRLPLTPQRKGST